MRHHIVAAVLAFIAMPATAHAYNSDPVCFDPARRPIAATAQPCAIRDPIGSHAIIAWFAARYLAQTFRDEKRAEGKAARWVAPFAGVARALGAFLKGANAPDTLDTSVDVYGGRGGDARGEVVFLFPRGDELLAGEGSVAGKIASALSGVVNRIGRFFGAKGPVIPSFRQVVRSALARLPDGQPKAFLSQVFSPIAATTSILREGLHPPLHFSALGHFVRRTARGVTGYRVTSDSSLWTAFADALFGSARGLLSAKVYSKLRATVEKTLRARLKTTVKKILANVEVRQFSADGRTGPQARTPRVSKLGSAQFTSANDMADWWYKNAQLYQQRGQAEAAVLSLAHAAHYVQDNALPHHNWGFLFKGHGEYEDRAGSYLAEFYARASANWKGRPAGFDKKVASALRMLRTHAGGPGALITGKLWQLVKAAHPNLPRRTRDLTDPGAAGAASDLARAVAATVWLVLKFHKSVVAKGAQAARK